MNEILLGDAWQLAKTLPDESINCIVTSPPYFGLRDYGTAQWEGGDSECDHSMPVPKGGKSTLTNWAGTPDAQERYAEKLKSTVQYRDLCGKCGARRVDSQFGLETTVEEYVDKLVTLFRELRRALRDDGTVWLNLGDSYANDGKWGGSTGGKHAGRLHGESGIGRGKVHTGLKPKDLCMIPARVALALQADGWWLRQDIIWAKTAPMPESVTDRCTKSHEYVFLLTKSPKYFYDADAIREEGKGYGRSNWNAMQFKGGDTTRNHGGKGTHGRGGGTSTYEGGRNKRSVWTLGPESYKGAHFAVMPTKLVEPCILSGCPHKVCAECGAPWLRVVEVEREGKSLRNPEKLNELAINGAIKGGITNRRLGPGVQDKTTTTGFAPTCDCNGDTRPGVVLDPFLGSGTVAAVARRLGRDWLGFELSPEYVELAWNRIGGTQPALFEVV